MNSGTLKLAALAILATLPVQFLAFGHSITGTVFAGIVAVLGALMAVL